ncbi:MAG TPA: hypothetical protein EYH12_00120, partial [Psychromonas hadalis]|nr:hypothetical protein [Psychromonas hadalis]
KSWFKQFWPWFLIILPMTAVVAGISTFIIATDNRPDMVVDDYYKKGKAINLDLSRLRHAKDLNISADIVITDQNLMISINNAPDKAAIKLSLHHATLAKRDMIQMLTSNADGQYVFENKQSLAGKWLIRIEPFDNSWRIEENIELPVATFTVK